MQGNITDWGKEVKKGLIERGWSINDLAERIGKSRTRVSGVVNGRIYSDSIASAISDLLNIEKASASMKEATRRHYRRWNHRRNGEAGAEKDPGFFR